MNTGQSHRTTASVDDYRQAAPAASALKQRWLLPILLMTVLTGCQGKSLVDDNPVFSETPPRRSLTNRSTVAQTDASPRAVITAVSHESSDVVPLTGNSVVAEVNGSPIFVDDLIGSIRLAVEDDPNLTPEQRQTILQTQIKSRLDNYIDQEIVLQALRQVIPADRQDAIRESLQEPFREVVGNIKADNNVETDQQLNEILAGQGLSIDLLRESFTRIQMVQGYLSSVATVEDAVDRIEMVEYYDQHRDEYTSEERIRCQEIVVLFSSHGGREGAEKRMAQVIEKLQQDGDFAELAVQFSDALSAEKRGDMGWLQRGSLADKDLENALFALEPQTMTNVYIRDDRLEVYRVVDHQVARTAPLSEVQQQIEATIRKNRRESARSKALKDLREKAVVVTMFDDEAETVRN
ncbi:MAG: peptidylprolyl isomerase [Fuerstiella sp.]